MQDDPFARAAARAQAAEREAADAKRDQWKKHASSGARTAFRVHANVFVMVNLLLVVIWATTGAGYPWFLYPLFGWGIGLLAHYSATQSLMRRRERRPAPATEPSYIAPAVPAPTPVAAAPTPAPAPAPAATPAAPSSSSTADEIGRLAKLHKAGALSDAEFTAAKAKLLQ